MSDAVDDVVESLRMAMGNYTQLIRQQLNTISALVEAGDVHVYQNHHSETAEQIELERLPNYPPANLSEAREAIRDDLMVNLTGGKSYVEMRMTELQPVRIPTTLSPIGDVTVATRRPTLRGNQYHNFFGMARYERHFQVIELGGSWEEPLFTARFNRDDWALEEDLTILSAYLWRCRDVSVDDVFSAWSQPAAFNVGNVLISTPTLDIVGGADNTDLSITLTGSTFNMESGLDTHGASTWTIFDNTGSVVFQVSQDEENLTELVVPYGHIFGNREYRAQVVYHSTLWGESAPGEIMFTTGDYTVEAPIIMFDDYRVEVPQILSIK